MPLAVSFMASPAPRRSARRRADLLPVHAKDLAQPDADGRAEEGRRAPEPSVKARGGDPAEVRPDVAPEGKPGSVAQHESPQDRGDDDAEGNATHRGKD